MTGSEGATLVRIARVTDAAAIAEFSALLGYVTSETSLARRLEHLDSAGNVVLVIESAGKVVGWVHVFRSHRLGQDPFGELGGLIVAPDHRGLGLGRLLMKAGEDWALANGCSMLRIRSQEKRADAHRFYERVGYQRVKRQQVLDKDLGR